MIKLNNLVKKKNRLQITLHKGVYTVRNNDKHLEVLKVLSLIVIAVSSVFIAIWLSQISQNLGGIANNLSGISNSLYDLSNKE